MALVDTLTDTDAENLMARVTEWKEECVALKATVRRAEKLGRALEKKLKALGVPSPADRGPQTARTCEVPENACPCPEDPGAHFAEANDNANTDGNSPEDFGYGASV